MLLVEAQQSAAAGEIDRSQMITQAEMAARLGTVREMIGRVLRDLAALQERIKLLQEEIAAQLLGGGFEGGKGRRLPAGKG